jgi:hypothetical protein
MRWIRAIGLVGVAAAADDLGDHAELAHAMRVETRRMDGQAVVFQYGEVRPDFEDRGSDEGQMRASLDGSWEFRFDPEQEGEKDGWARDGGDGWKTVMVPHCWDVMPTWWASTNTVARWIRSRNWTPT